MRAVACVVLTTLLGGCSNILGIHALSDADVTSSDGKPGDGHGVDTSLIDTPTSQIDSGVDGMLVDGGATVPIGDYAQLGSMTTINANFVIARRFTVSASTVIVGAGAYLKFESVNGHIKFAIYNENANAPYTRRVMSAADITLDGVAGYNDGPLGPHTLPAGSYWMVIATDASIDIGSQDTNNVAGATASLTYASAFPTTYNPQPVASTMADRINLYLQAQP